MNGAQSHHWLEAIIDYCRCAFNLFAIVNRISRSNIYIDWNALPSMRAFRCSGAKKIIKSQSRVSSHRERVWTELSVGFWLMWCECVHSFVESMVKPMRRIMRILFRFTYDSCDNMPLPPHAPSSQHIHTHTIRSDYIQNLKTVKSTLSFCHVIAFYDMNNV